MKKIIITIVSFSLIILGGCLNIIRENSYSNRLVNPDFIQMGFTASISDDVIIRQEFLSRESDIVAIKVRFATFYKEVQGIYCFDIYNSEDKLLESQKINGKDIHDNSYYTVNLNNQLEKGEKYYFVLYQQEDFGDTVVIWNGLSNAAILGDCYVNGVPQTAKLDVRLVEEDLFRPIASFVIPVVFLMFAILSFMTKSPKLIFAIYSFAMLIFVGRCYDFFACENLGLYDEMTHVSYLAYMENDDVIIPEFEDMKMLVVDGTKVDDAVQVTALQQTRGIFRGEFSDTVSYLGHPPLYYWILSVVDAVDIDGENIYVNMSHLRLFNLIIVVLGLMVIFYIGFTRIQQDPKLHLFYSTAIVSFPLLGFTALTVNNDNLTILTMALAILGAIRIFEKKYDYKTYLLIAIGVCGTIMTKLTAGFIIVMVAIMVVVYKCFVLKEKESVLNKEIIVTLPIYVITLMYFISLLLRYGSVQPSLPDLVDMQTFMNYSSLYKAENLENPMNFIEYVDFFLKRFMNQWTTGPYTINYPILTDVEKQSSKIILIGVWVFVLLYMFAIFSKDKKKKFLGMFAIGIIITVAYQLFTAWKSYSEYGHGGMQSRYYICVFFVMILIIVNAFENINSRCKKSKLAIIVSGTIICLLSFAFLRYGYTMYLT